jgi:ABC-type lipoprotein release transport system permease subunit
MILQQGLKLVFVGSILGMAGAFALTRLLASYLFEVRVLDPLTFLAVPLLLLLVTTAACLIPGWTATRISPIEALRYE